MRKLLLLNVLLVITTLFCGNAWAQKGAISGKITDEDNLSLPGASIYIESLMLGTASNNAGNFVLPNVPAGNHTVTISYIGYGAVTQQVNVVAGQTVTLGRISMKAGVSIGQEVVILGDRLKGQAKALNQQRTNYNITNIVAADQIGRFPDANIGDAMKRIPGVTMQNDQGEARDIIIRGLAPQLNSVMLNGVRIPSAEGNNRRVQMDLIPADMIQTIEVSKAVTPDMDGDAIGGAVNLVTRAAPNGLRISGTLASGFNFLSEKPIWTGSFILGNRFFNNKLGVILSTSYNNHNFGSDNIEAEWEKTDNGEDYLAEFQQRTYDVQRIRRSTSIALDYKIAPNHTIFLKGIYNWRDDWENRFRTDVAIDPELDADGNMTGMYTARFRKQTKGGLNNDRIQNRRLEDQRQASLMLSGQHLFGSKIKLTWDASVSRASEQRPHERYARYQVKDVMVNVDVANPRFPISTPMNAGDLTPSRFKFNEMLEENQFTYQNDVAGRIDLELPVLSGANQSTLKVGARIRNKEKVRDNRFDEYEPNVAGFETMGNAAVTDATRDFLAGSQYKAGLYTSPEYLGSLNFYNTALFDRTDKLDEYVPGNYRSTENITAGYLMYTQNIGSKFSFIAGLRVENTSLTSKGFEIDVETASSEADIKEVNGTQNYTNYLPALHLRYNLSQNTIFRAAWTNTIARPNFFDLVPYREINSDENALSIGNPALNPTTSMNFDFMAEHYFKSIGLVSGGVFYKDIKNFIYTQELSNYTDPVSGQVFDDFNKPLNGSSATLLGFEVSFQRQLDFLPGLLKGLGVYVNYTYNQSTTEGFGGDNRTEDVRLPGTSPHMINASLSFETKRLVLRASFNFADAYIDELGKSAYYDRYYDRQMFVDLNGSYAFTKKLRFFFEVNNLTNQPLRYFQGRSDRTMQAEWYNVRFSAGLKFDLYK